MSEYSGVQLNMMNLLFNADGDYIERPTVGGIDYAYEIAVDIKTEWEGKLDCLVLREGIVSFDSTAHYVRERSNVYPDIETQLDMIYWDMKNSTTLWSDVITQVKLNYPKGV